jgi:ActR/RegA family two-component response regulator
LSHAHSPGGALNQANNEKSWNLYSLLNLSLGRIGATGGIALENPLLLVLVVEDDHLIKDVVQEALSDGGFDSEVVASGEEAVALLQDKHDEYRAPVTDIDLQGELSGWDVAKRARELRSDIPVVY